jgi:hypothetical protein
LTKMPDSSILSSIGLRRGLGVVLDGWTPPEQRASGASPAVGTKIESKALVFAYTGVLVVQGG